MTTADEFRCICDPNDLFDPPDPRPRAVEGCLAHQTRRTVQQILLQREADAIDAARLAAETEALAQRLGCSLHGGVALATKDGGTGWIDCGPAVCGYTCPDHPGPLDDARGHICRPRPAKAQP